MGLFDSIVGQVSSALSNSNNNNHNPDGLMGTIIGLINNPETGGIQGLIDTFKEKGLGDTFASWIGTGQNLPVSNEQIQAVLGSEQVQSIAQKLGISSADASSGIANLLPQVIDKLTPNGQFPTGDILEQGIELLKGFGKQD
ncbi:MAG: protein of unknown function (DUF937) [Candidatus Nitrotoga sp. SPKER]|nr:MAG: protein of unknown function (DUF937) [Candidatus Nitrotoga sp. SPKER]